MCSGWFDWITLRIWLNDFEMFIWVYNDEIDFRMMKITLKPFYKTVWKQCQENYVKIKKLRAVYHNIVTQLLL